MKYLFILIFFTLPIISKADICNSKKRFCLSPNIKMGKASVESSDGTTVPAIDLYEVEVGASTSMRITSRSPWRLGFAAGYAFIRQSSEPADVNDLNFEGSQLNYGPLIEYMMPRFSILALFYLSSEFTFDKADSLGNDLIYHSESFPSFSLQAGYALTPKSYLGLQYKQITYTAETRAGRDNVLTGDEETTFTTIGLMYGWMF